MTQAEKILELLRERGAVGASNFELMHISYQYPARIHTLRHKLGHEISNVHVEDKEWRITLVKDTDAPVRPPESEKPRDNQATLIDMEPAKRRLQIP